MKFLRLYKTFESQSFDKYDLLDQIEDCVLSMDDKFRKFDKYYIGDMKVNDVYCSLNDTKDNPHADDNYTIYIKLDPKEFPFGLSTDISYLKSTSIFNQLNTVMIRLNNLKEEFPIKKISFSYSNKPFFNEYVTEKQIHSCMISISIKINDRSFSHREYSMLDNNNIMHSGSSMAVILKDYILTTDVPSMIGSNYENSVSHIDIRDKNWNMIGILDMNPKPSMLSSHYHEQCLLKYDKKNSPSLKIIEWYNILMKQLGSNVLYPHDFFIWLKKNNY